MINMHPILSKVRAQILVKPSRKILAIFGVAAVIVLSSSAVAAQIMYSQHADRHVVEPKRTTTVSAAAKKSNNTDSQAATNTQAANTSASTPKQASPGTTAVAKTATPTPAASSNQKFLKISPAAITVKAGEAYTGLTIQADDGRPINMPMISASSNPNMFLNFPAGPAKSVWSGSIAPYRLLAPGTYTVNLMGQADRTTFYRSSITVTVLPIPLMQVSIQPLGYDAEADEMDFLIKAERLNGFDAPITSVFGHSYANNIECASLPLGNDTFGMSCWALPGTRPTTGSLHVNVNTPGDSFNSDAPFTLPAL